MPDTVSFDTLMVVVITEFCIMATVLVFVVGRSFDRAFKHLEEMTAAREYIQYLTDQIGFCEKHAKLYSVVDTVCEECFEEYKKERT